MYIYGQIALNFSDNEKCFRQKLYRKSIHNYTFNDFFSPKHCAVYETMMKNMLQPDRPQTTV